MTEIKSKRKNPREFFSDRTGYPSKSLGQNFLRDKRVLSRIINLAELTEDDQVLEIGPGLGALTEELAKRAGRVVAVEKDKKLITHLSELTQAYGNIELISEDSLNIDFRSLFKGGGIKVVSNLPYSVSTPILIKLLETRDIFSSLVLMLQLEVGERIASGPGTKKYGSISVLLQTYFDITLEFRVPPAAFWPKPKVHSVVLKLVPLPSPRVHIADEKLYEKVIRAAFSSRRKMLGNSLQSGFSKDFVLKALELSEIDRKRRAETLTIKEFGALAENISKQEN
jgi:16S rRNA (adenine1518-N6/adenine1519-N6)-dimethyltransferase